eukprot:5767575-Lingulodinium_polyedra.AAC.1
MQPRSAPRRVARLITPQADVRGCTFDSAHSGPDIYVHCSLRARVSVLGQKNGHRHVGVASLPSGSKGTYR